MSAPSASIPSSVDGRWEAEYVELQAIVKPDEIAVGMNMSDAPLTPEQTEWLKDQVKEQLQRLMESLKIKTYPPTLHMARKMVGHHTKISITPQVAGASKTFYFRIVDGTSSQAVVKHKRAVFKINVSISQSIHTGRFSRACLHAAEEGITPFAILCFLEKMDSLDADGLAVAYIKKFVEDRGQDGCRLKLACCVSAIQEELADFFVMSTQQPADSRFVRALVNSVCMEHLCDQLSTAYAIAHR